MAKATKTTAKKSWKKEYTAEQKAEYREQKKEDEKLDFSLVTNLLVNRCEEVIAMGNEYAEKWVRSFPSCDPQNISGRTYNGFNRRYLGMLGVDYTITPKQLLYWNRKQFGKDESKYLKPKEGAILYPIFKYGYKEYIYTKVNEETGEEEKKVGASCWYKGYRVYDIGDIEGFPCPKERKIKDHKDELDIPLARAISKVWSTIVPIKQGYSGACFVGGKDNGEIHVPYEEECDSLAEFLCTLYHEITHSTGQFVKRDMKGAFGTPSYAREECVAEFGGVIFSELLGIRAKIFDNAIAYIRDWIRYLADDPKVLYYASKKSEEAVEYVIKKYNELKSEEDPEIEYCPWKQEEEDEPEKETKVEKPKKESKKVESKKTEPVVEFNEQANTITLDAETYKKLMAMVSLIG